MPESIDDILKAVKQEYENQSSDQPSGPQSSEGRSPQSIQPKPSIQPKSAAASTPAPSPTPAPHPRKKSVESLLADIGMGSPTPSPTRQRPIFPTVHSSKPPQSSPSSSPPTAKRPLFPTVQSSPAPTPAPSSSWSSPGPTSKAVNSVFANVKDEYEAKQAEAERQRQAALEAERERQHQVEQQRRVERSRRAQEWLDHLDPNSDEGFWFEGFAVNYPSRLDAALEYLDALEALD